MDEEQALARREAALLALAAARTAYENSHRVGRTSTGAMRHGFGLAELMALEAAEQEVLAAEAALAQARASVAPWPTANWRRWPADARRAPSPADRATLRFVEEALRARRLEPRAPFTHRDLVTWAGLYHEARGHRREPGVPEGSRAWEARLRSLWASDLVERGSRGRWRLVRP
jgi:hypothetical protein